jgi:hypothetical protein
VASLEQEAVTAQSIQSRTRHPADKVPVISVKRDLPLAADDILSSEAFWTFVEEEQWDGIITRFHGFQPVLQSVATPKVAWPDPGGGAVGKSVYYTRIRTIFTVNSREGIVRGLCLPLSAGNVHSFMKNSPMLMHFSIGQFICNGVAIKMRVRI